MLRTLAGFKAYRQRLCAVRFRAVLRVSKRGIVSLFGGIAHRVWQCAILGCVGVRKPFGPVRFFLYNRSLTLAELHLLYGDSNPVTI